jgi:hypothetical protein
VRLRCGPAELSYLRIRVARVADLVELDPIVSSQRALFTAAFILIRVPVWRVVRLDRLDAHEDVVETTDVDRVALHVRLLHHPDPLRVLLLPARARAVKSDTLPVRVGDEDGQPVERNAACPAGCMEDLLQLPRGIGQVPRSA